MICRLFIYLINSIVQALQHQQTHRGYYSAVQNQTAVTTYFSSDQLLSLYF